MKSKTLIIVVVLIIIGGIVYTITNQAGSGVENGLQLPVDEVMNGGAAGTRLAGDAVLEYPLDDTYRTVEMDTPNQVRWQSIAITLPAFWVAASADGGPYSTLRIAAPGMEEAIEIAYFTGECEGGKTYDSETERGCLEINQDAAEIEGVDRIIDSTVIITEENETEFAELTRI